MGITVKASDLYYRYRKNVAARHEPKFAGKPDPRPFDRDDVYEVLPLLGKVLDELGRDDMQTLHVVEEIMIRNLPGFVSTREEVFDFLVATARDELDELPR